MMEEADAKQRQIKEQKYLKDRLEKDHNFKCSERLIDGEWVISSVHSFEQDREYQKAIFKNCGAKSADIRDKKDN